MMDLINPLLNVVTSLHGEALVVFILIVIGYILKTAFFFPNDWIPRVNLVLGMLLCVLVVQWPDPADTWMQKVLFPTAAAWANTLMKGVGLFFIAWIIHHKVLKVVIDDKVPAMNPGMTKDKTTTEEIRVDAAGETKTKTEQEVTTNIDPSKAAETMAEIRSDALDGGKVGAHTPPPAPKTMG